MEDLARRVVVVTGAASGIGRALVDAFGAEGCRVVLADIEEEPLAHAVSDLQEAGVEATGFVCDVTDESSVVALRAHAEQVFGPVDVVCNNAGVAPIGPFLQTTAK